jgi:hypothetical protein
MKRGLVVALITTLISASCGDTPDSVTGPSDVALTTEHFSGTLTAGQVRFFSFTVNGSGPVAVTLASVTSPVSGLALSTPLDLGLGIPLGTGCAVKRRVTAVPALIAQINDSTIPGIYCVEIGDSGALSTSVNFAARFTHP